MTSRIGYNVDLIRSPSPARGPSRVDDGLGLRQRPDSVAAPTPKSAPEMGFAPIHEPLLRPQHRHYGPSSSGHTHLPWSWGLILSSRRCRSGS